VKQFPKCVWVGLTLASLLSGCASMTSGTKTSAALGCSELNAEVERTDQARREAVEKKQGAWKFVVPVAVVGRYAQGAVAAGQADKRLDELKTERVRQGCAAGAG
jgi:hypothetical protein